MELDDFKNILKEKNKTTGKFPEISIEDVKKRKSINPVDKLRKQVLVEYLVGIPLLIIMDIAAVALNKYLNNVTIWAFFVLSILIALYSGRFVLKTRKQLRFNEDTVDFLQNFKSSFETYLKLAQSSILIITPLFTLLGYISGTQIAAPAEYLEKMFRPKSMAIILIVTIVMTFGYYYLVKIFYKRIYRKNLNEIQQIIDELNNSNEN